RLGRRFELVDFVGGEGVAGLLAPIGLAIQDVVVEAQLFELLLPARPRCRGLATHFSLPPMSRGPSSRSRRAGSGWAWLCWYQSWSIRCRARWSFLRRRCPTRCLPADRNWASRAGRGRRPAADRRGWAG